MNGEHTGGMDCGHFEALLSDALDGMLGQSELAGFHAHAAACEHCRPMLAEAQAGLNWLKSLAQVDPPRNLVRNILIATSGAEHAPARAAAPAQPWRDRLLVWTRPLATVFSGVAQPRFALSLGMAFFSLAVLLNAAGLHVSKLRVADLRPSAIQDNLSRTYDETTARVVKYYENIRFVYEIESRVREFRNATRQEDEQQQNTQPEKPKDRKHRDDNTSEHPEQKQDRYSRQNQPVVLADSPLRESLNPTADRGVA